MTRQALVELATNKVVNIIELESEAEWSLPIDHEVRASEDAEIGWLWNGSTFSSPVIPEPPRIDVLMSEGPATRVYNEATEVMDERPADDIAADKAELLGLLQDKLGASEDLTWDQMNKMLALERES